MAKRTIIRIDEEKCNGCGLCVPACAEGAIQIVDGKAKLVSETYCDGLGACLGDCPQDAITMEEREAAEYDQKAVDVHLKKIGKEPEPHRHDQDALPCGCPGTMTKSIGEAGGGCPSSKAAVLEKNDDSGSKASNMGDLKQKSRLTNWPVQIRLMPVNAPYLDNADLLIAADCAPFAFAGFHERFVKGRIVLMGCPKLDDAGAYVEKLATMFQSNSIRTIEVPYMEVPCCGGLISIIRQAMEKSGKQIPVILTKISLEGEIMESKGL